MRESESDTHTHTHTRVPLPFPPPSINTSTPTLKRHGNRCQEFQDTTTIHSTSHSPFSITHTYTHTSEGNQRHARPPNDAGRPMTRLLTSSSSSSIPSPSERDPSPPSHPLFLLPPERPPLSRLPSCSSRPLSLSAMRSLP
jgi:hypothetical protein